MPLERTPAVFLRFIGVMEYANSTLVDPKRELVRQISDLISRGYRINISAESAVYADKLADEIGSPVAATPVPPDHQLMPPSDAKDFCVISPVPEEWTKALICCLTLSQNTAEDINSLMFDLLFRIFLCGNYSIT